MEQDDEENDDFREIMECDATISVGNCTGMIEDLFDVGTIGTPESDENNAVSEDSAVDDLQEPEMVETTVANPVIGSATNDLIYVNNDNSPEEIRPSRPIRTYLRHPPQNHLHVISGPQAVLKGLCNRNHDLRIHLRTNSTLFYP